MKVSESLKAAKASLREATWRKGGYFSERDGLICMCAHGAVQAQINSRVAALLSRHSEGEHATRRAAMGAQFEASQSGASTAAKQSATYAQWPYRALLESRLANAAANVEPFRVEPREQPALDKKFVTGSAFTCTVCHQKEGVGAL